MLMKIHLELVVELLRNVQATPYEIGADHTPFRYLEIRD